MFIDINKIGPEGLDLKGSPDLRSLAGDGGESLAVLALSLTARLDRTARGAEIRGRLDGRVEVVCSRCLAPMEEVVRTDFFLVAVSGTEEQPGPDPEDDPEERRFREALLSAPDGKVDLDQVAAEQIYLNLARKPVCSPDCRGLCPGCGVNRNEGDCSCAGEDIDPRLAPLLKFRKN